MAILHVANLGQPVLRNVAEPVRREEIATPMFQTFLDDLVQSMLFHDGVGLAGPQVFRPQRVIVVQVPAELDESGAGIEPTVFINPVLTPDGDEKVPGWEGCLSLKDLRGIVPRFRAVRLQALDRRGARFELDLTGFPARVLQHEVDHLDGIVFADRMEGMSSLTFARELAMLGDEDEEAEEA